MRDVLLYTPPDHNATLALPARTLAIPSLKSGWRESNPRPMNPNHVPYHLTTPRRRSIVKVRLTIQLYHKFKILSRTSRLNRCSSRRGVFGSIDPEMFPTDRKGWSREDSPQSSQPTMGTFSRIRRVHILIHFKCATTVTCIFVNRHISPRALYGNRTHNLIFTKDTFYLMNL